MLTIQKTMKKTILLLSLAFFTTIKGQQATILNFDGQDDYISLPQVISGDFTMEYLMQTSMTGGTGFGITAHWWSGTGIVDAEVASWQYDFGTALYGSQLAFGIGSPSGGDVTIFSSSNINTGNWTHVAVTWAKNTGAMQLYINGILESTAIGDTTLRTAPSGIDIGRLLTGVNSYYNGNIDELRIWNYVRSQSDISSNMNCELNMNSPQSGLLAYYRFDQGIAAGSNPNEISLLDLSTNLANGGLNNFSLSGSLSNWLNGTTISSPPQITITTSSNAICPGRPVTLSAIGANTYTWNNGSNLTNIIVTPTITTTYTVWGNGAGGCPAKQLFTQYVTACTGISEFIDQLPGFKLYPNPTKGAFNIEIDCPAEIIIINSLGQVIYQNKLFLGLNTIETNTAPGIYFINILVESDKIMTPKYCSKLVVQ